MSRPEARPAAVPTSASFGYLPTLAQVFAAIADAEAYEAERRAIEVELFGYADGEEWLLAA